MYIPQKQTIMASNTNNTKAKTTSDGGLAASLMCEETGTRCPRRQMLGTSWWKQLGYRSPCLCALIGRATWIRDFNKNKDNITDDDVSIAEAMWHIYTLSNACVVDRQRRPYRLEDSLKELRDAIKECVNKFGFEKTQNNLPKGITLKE